MSTPAELRHDFDIAVRALQEIHPALDAHITKAEFARQAEEGRRRLDRPMTSLQFFRAIAPLIASVRCYHTWLLPSAADMENFEANTEVLPLDVVVRPEGVFVRQDLSAGAKIAPGSKLVKIDGREVKAAVAELLRNYDLAQDGVGKSPRYAKLSRPGYFARVYSLYFQDAAPREVEFIAPGARHSSTEAIVPKKAGELLQQLTPEATQFKLEFTPDGSTAVLTIKSLGENAAFEPFLEQSFREIQQRHTANLIVDLRDNGGGEDLYGVALYSYLARAPFRYYASLETTKAEFAQAKDDPNFPAEAFRKRLDPIAGGRYRVRASAHPGLQVHPPNPLHFEGRVYFLVNGLTGSAATEVAAIAHSSGRALFVGEETGGGYAMDTSGPHVELRLPNTGVRVEIPTVEYRMAVARNVFPNHGLVPQVQIQPTVEDIVTGNDRAMQYVLHLIHARKNDGPRLSPSRIESRSTIRHN